MDITSSFPNQGSTAKYICPIILSVIILWFCRNGRSYNLSHSSTPLDISQDPLGYLGIHKVLTGLSGCMVSCIFNNIGIWLPQGIVSSIHGLWTRGYKIEIQHEIRVPRSIFFSTPGLGHKNNFKPCKRYILPRAQT